jgi:hypothetical protein
MMAGSEHRKVHNRNGTTQKDTCLTSGGLLHVMHPYKAGMYSTGRLLLAG